MCPAWTVAKISEDEKYGGSNYVSKENKGERKQEEWVMKIKEKVSSTKNMEPQLKELLEKIILHSNIPRKEGKFRNFMRSSCRVSNPKLVDKVWEIFKDANTKNDNSSSSNGVNKDANITDKDNSSNDVPEAFSETAKDDTDAVKLSKRERKELRREKQSKKSKKDKHSEHGKKGKAGTKRKLDSIEEEEPNVVTEEPSKKKKRKKGDSIELDGETVEVKKKKKKKNISQEEALPQSNENKIKNGTIATNRNHALGEGKENLVEPQHHAVFKWTNAIKTVLKLAPEEGLKVSKLQRKVFSLYYSAYGDAPNVKSKGELVALLSQKLNKKSKFIMHKDRVKLRK